MRTRRPAARSQPGSTRRGSVRFGSSRRGSPRLSHLTGGPLGLCRVGPGRRWAAGSGAAACCVRKLSWCRRTASGFIFQECESFPLASRRELKFNSGGAAPPNPRPGPSFASRTPRPWDPCPWVPLPGNHARSRTALVCVSSHQWVPLPLVCRSCCWCVAIISVLHSPNIPTSMHSLVDPIAFGLAFTRGSHHSWILLSMGSLVHGLHSPLGPVAHG